MQREDAVIMVINAIYFASDRELEAILEFLGDNEIGGSSQFYRYVIGQDQEAT